MGRLLSIAIFSMKARESEKMERYKLEKLTEVEKKLAEENHNLVYAFLHTYNYSIEMYYNIVIFGYLKGIQVYSRREDLRKKYDMPFICWQYMRAEIGNHFRTETMQKRKPMENIISLDADYATEENLYNCIGGKTLEEEALEEETVLELLEKLSEVQRKIAEMKMDGYGNKEIFLLLEMPESTFYKEMNRIKTVVKNLLVKGSL